MKHTDTLRIAILGASHWHIPLYLDALGRPDLLVVAVADADAAARHRVGARFAATTYASAEELLAAETIDFAFVFGIHAEMPTMATALIARGIPFAIEKPCGLDAATVLALRDAADGLFVAVPLVFRMSALFTALAGVEGGLPSRFNHLGFRFMAGPAARYIDAGCAWMLEPALSGGGCAINLAIHFIDLFHCLTGQAVSRVSAVMRAGSQGIAVEDHAVLLLTGADGTIGTIETSYTYPSTADDLRELSLSLSSESAYIHSTPTGIRIRRPGEVLAENLTLQLAPDATYGDFVSRTIADLRSGRPPVAGLQDAARAMCVIDAAYLSAQTNGNSVEIGIGHMFARVVDERAAAL
jgi:predicted dehydrogenase